jgi:hypothetical protein
VSGADDLATTPGLRALAVELMRPMRGSQLVLLRYPDRAMREEWTPVVRIALNATLAERGEIYPVLMLDGNRTEGPAEPWFKLAVGGSERDTLRQALVGTRDQEPIVLVLDSDGGLPSDWRALFTTLARYYRTPEGGVYLRSVLVLLSGAGPAFPLDGITGITDFAHWQPLLWEEMRLLARRRLPDLRSNPLREAWTISTYVGAASGDPFLLERLCQTLPQSLAEITRHVREGSGTLAVTEADACGAGMSVASRRWAVPSALEDLWHQGKVTGWTFERGLSLAWSRLPPSDRALRLAIWREQVAGLMPSLIEMAIEANHWLRHAAPSAWRAAVKANDGATVESSEPGVVLSAFSGIGERMPQDLHRLLTALRNMRNKLAHQVAVDEGDVGHLWAARDTAGRVNRPTSVRRESAFPVFTNL